MTDLTTLLALSFNAERVSARRLAQRTSIDQEAALRSTLEIAAGSAGLDALLAARIALRDAATARLAARTAAKAAALATRKSRHDGPPSAWRAWFDGSAHPNPGRCGIGALLLGPHGERIEISRPAGDGNSSEAEYLALIAVLEAATSTGAHGVTIYGDSQVVIMDMTGEAATQASALFELRERASALMAQLEGVTLRWIPRHKNGAADALSQRAVRRDGALTGPET